MQTNQVLDSSSSWRSLYPVLGTTIRSDEDQRLAWLQQTMQEQLPHLDWFLEMRQKLRLPDIVISTAIDYSVRLKKKRLLRNERFVKEAILFLACRMCGVERDPKLYTDRPKKVAFKAYQVAELLSIEVKPLSVDRQIFNALAKLRLNHEFYHDMMADLQALRSGHPSGCSRMTDAATLTWVIANAAGIRRSQKEVGDAFGVKECTVRERFAQLKRLVEEGLS